MRGSKKYNVWRLAVIQRDGKCMNCQTLNNLISHHIVPWKESVELRFEISNGLTLCRSCHMKHHKNRKGVKGQVPWNKGLKGISTGMPKGSKFTVEHRDKLSARKLGKTTWNKGLKGDLSHMKGRKMPFKGKTWKIDPTTEKRCWID